MELTDIEITDMRNGTFALESGGQPFGFCDDREHAETIKNALERCARDLTAFACVVDADDHRDIMAAVERRKAWDCEPDESDSCELGGMLAEICRGWMERVEHDKQCKLNRTDNGDGTVTFHGIDVTVRADVLGGRDVVAVRRVESGERYIDSFGSVHTCVSGHEYRLRVILGQKPHPPAPPFETGKFYRAKAGGEIIGPIKGPSDMHAADWETLTSMLEPGEVIVWRHPGLRAGKWIYDGSRIHNGYIAFAVSAINAAFAVADATPPRAGTWLVRAGQEYATWEGK